MKSWGNWRVPVIFAVPVLLWVVLLWALVQPKLGVSATTHGTDTVMWGTTPLPTFMPTPNPTVVPTPTAAVAYVLPCSSGVTSITVTPAVANGQVTLRVTDQRGKPVVCAWLSQRGGNYGILGGTDTTGTVSAALASMPHNTHIVETATIGTVAAGVDFFVEH